MSTKSADEAECKSVAATQSVEGSMKLEDTITLSDEFFAIFELSFTYSEKPNSFSKKQVKAMETKMDGLYNKVINSEHTSLYDIITLANSYEILCFVYRNKSGGKKEISMARNFILRCLSLIKDKELNPRSILIALKAYYHLGYIFSKQREFYKAIESYNKGVELYFKYTGESQEYDIPFDINVIMLPETLNGYEKLNALYINLLEAAIEFHKLQVPINKEYLMAYEHLFLVANLNILTKTKRYFEWIHATLLLIHDLLKSNRLMEARSHITTALSVKKVFYEEIYQQMSSLEMLQVDKDITSLFIKCRTQYGVALLRKSVTLLLRLEEDSATNDLKSKYPTKSKNHILQRLLSFDEMKGGNPFTNDSNQSVMLKNISGYDDAHKLFIHTVPEFNKKYHFYHSTEGCENREGYIQFISDISNLYKYMALYEKDIASRILLQTRHIDILLEPGIKKICLLHPVMFKRSLIQLAIGFSILIDTKLESLEESHVIHIQQKHYASMCEIAKLVKKALITLKLYVTL